MHSAITAPETIRLRAVDCSVYLRATQRFEFADSERYEGERKVVTAQYVYTLAEDEDLAQELFSWQWHPGDWSHPHLHVRTDHKLHIPTGRVAFEQVLLVAITDYGVEPAKTDAPEILAETLRRFRLFRSWA
jgi:hypothetical protein